MATSNSNSIMDIDNHKQVSNEEVLSQKLNQFSPFKKNEKKQPVSTDTIQIQTTISTTELPLSKMIGIDLESIPDYLCPTNQSFEKKLHSILPSTINLEELRDIAILTYKIMSIGIIHPLWLAYQRSGTGDLPSTLPIKQEERKIWPILVQSLAKQFQLQNDNNADKACFTLVKHCLDELNRTSKRYRDELNAKTSCLCGYDRSIEYTIEKFVQQGLQFFRITIDQQIALVQYHYTDELLQQSYLAQNPYENQIQIMKRLCKLSYNKEMAKREVNLLKEKISSHITSHPFQSESIAQSSLIDTVKDSCKRQQLYQQSKNVAEEARTQMMTTYIECAEEQMKQCQQQHDIELKDIWNMQKSLPIDQQLTTVMQNLIEQRLANITAQIECIYKFKTQLFRLKQTIH